jgi:hypothetical protein
MKYELPYEDASRLSWTLIAGDVSVAAYDGVELIANPSLGGILTI